MVTRQSEATWEGNLREGEGTMTVGDDYYTGEYTYLSRFQEGDQTNPEELIGAAHAGCFSMALSSDLDKAGFPPERVHTTATVHLEEGTITKIELETEATVPDIGEDEFQEIANGSKENCPVSRPLAAAEITLVATLV